MHLNLACIIAAGIEILMLQIFFSEDFSRNLSGGIQETNTHLLFSWLFTSL